MKKNSSNIWTKNIPVKQSYRLEHDMGYRSFRDTNVEDIPVTSTYTIMADDLGEYHQPGGLVRIYEKSNDHSSSVFVGSGNVGNIRKGGEFKIDAGRTQDITATYTVKNIGKLQIHDVSGEHHRFCEFQR